MSTPILKSLKADPGDKVDLSQHEPEGLNAAGKEVWDHLVGATPYWWAEADLLTIERYCYLIGIDRTMRTAMNRAEADQDYDRFNSLWKSMKSLSLELKAVEYSLGVTPQARAALKLEEPADQDKREKPEETEAPLDPEDL